VFRFLHLQGLYEKDYQYSIFQEHYLLLFEVSHSLGDKRGHEMVSFGYDDESILL